MKKVREQKSVSKSCRMLFLLLAQLFLILPPQANAEEATAYIIGGDDSSREYPWMVALYSGDAFICGGVLISSGWVATAAHCVFDSFDTSNSNAVTAVDTDTITLLIGGTTHYSSLADATSAGLSSYSINSITIHPSYTDSTDPNGTGYSYDYDIALLELDSTYYQPGPSLATSDRFNTLEEGDDITALGYGYTTVSGVAPDTLQEADLPYIDDDSCEAYWPGSVSDRMFCAGEVSNAESSTIATCDGDSGGPLYITAEGEMTLVGLVSWGSSSCLNAPGGYTKISVLRSWITGTIDGFQVVEEGTASYDTDAGTFESGLISVYNYNDTDSVSVGSLGFDDESSASEVITWSDSCSDSTVYSTDGSCSISFDLNSAISSGDTFTASLSAESNSYSLRFSTEAIAESTSDTSSSDSDSGGPVGPASLLILALAAFRRRTS
ncbi:serine protease [Vibrio sp. JC009]|uniref:serine protease n=1 Tax=Vibrio sp. JC009 TaxID=2912314 RepID=UPI0023AF99D8|nr:serine protease [Vibrio sp. JC009]WED21580.1 serine protease [Vibrio sp. JC009]